jgi:hypothetical protein
MANRRFIDFPVATTVGANDIILIWQDGLNKQTTKATILSGLPEDLEDLADVNISGLTNGQILRYDSTTGKWENTDQGNLDLDDLNDVSIVSPSNGQVLFYNSSTSKWENSSILTGFVPYTGATADVNLGTHDLTAERGTFANNGSSDTLTVNHTSGSGYGIIVTKGGNNEALYVNKTSGSGNAMAVVGGRTSLVDLSLSSVSNATGNFLTISGGVVHQRTASETRSDVGAQAQLNGTGFVKASGTTISYDNSTYLTTDTAQTITGIKTFDFSTLRINSTGTAQVTIFRNSSSTQQANTGINTFGFNSDNDIYFNKGSIASGGTFKFDNTLERVYTLPNASGTIALTSNLGAYLPLTGGTLTGALNGTSASFTGSLTTGAPSGGTAKPFKVGAVATVSPTSPDRTIEIEIEGTTYYLSAKTTNN